MKPAHGKLRFTPPANASGTFRIPYTVGDGHDGTDHGTLTVHVTPVNDAPIATFTVSPGSGTAPLDVAADAAGSRDVEGPLASYAWSFGDGGTGSGMNARHAYVKPGTYTITLTVVDGSGAKATATNVVTVRAAAVERDRVSGQLKRGAKVLWRASGALGSGDFVVKRDGKGGVKRVQGSGGLPDGTTVTLVARRTGRGFSGSVRVDDGPQRIGPTLAVRRIVTLGGGKVRVEAQKTVGKGKQRKTYKLKLTLLKDVTPK